MCCRVIIEGAAPQLLELLPMAGFQLDEALGEWYRRIPEEGTRVRVRSTGSRTIDISIWPSVTTYEQHADKRLAAGLMFQVAGLLAEKCNGTVSQHATVSGCLSERASVKVVAQYPDEPLKYDALCPGWREIFIPL